MLAQIGLRIQNWLVKVSRRTAQGHPTETDRFVGSIDIIDRRRDSLE
jgi:hypothetical protein